MMQLPSDQLKELHTLIDRAKEIMLALPKSPNLDKTATALSFFLALSGKGKQVKIVCPEQMTVEFNQLVGVDKITTSATGGNGRNLIISFPYQEGSIEKVSYNIENDTFNLVIEPREGYPIISSNDMRYSFGGGNVDIIITIGVAILTDLNSLYQNSQDLFATKPIINIDSQNQNQRFGKLNIIDPSVSSVSELGMYLLSQLNLPVDPDIASNLLAGITSGSQNFTSKETSITTFEAATVCLRNGARKSMPNTPHFQPANFQPPQHPAAPKPAFTSYPIPNSPFPKSSGGIKTPQIEPKQSTMSQPHQPPYKQTSSYPKQQPAEAPPDWLKPKIYKGSTLL